MESGVVTLAPFNKAIPAGVVSLVKKKRAALVSGKMKVFQGPIQDQRGKIKIPAGRSATAQEMLSMKYFVQGVVGTLPGEKK